ncbi:MAG: thiamine phosphate synthase [Tannerellaceae bacterium]|nr:thiamine phosphate synthase [Tannerellaceae bacterium]
MRLIVITPETDLPGETGILGQLFDAGLEHLHIRKPQYTKQQMEQYLSEIDPVWYRRVVLHDRFDTGFRKGIRRFHLNSRNPFPPAEREILVSRSCHSLQEITLYINQPYDYLFLSPVFDSISKKGYTAGFSEDLLQQAFSTGVLNNKIVALGGITVERIPQIRLWGFGGVAVLGALWNSLSPVARFKELKHICEVKDI